MCFVNRSTKTEHSYKHCDISFGSFSCHLFPILMKMKKTIGLSQKMRKRNKKTTKSDGIFNKVNIGFISNYLRILRELKRRKHPQLKLHP